MNDLAVGSLDVHAFLSLELAIQPTASGAQHWVGLVLFPLHVADAGNSSCRAETGGARKKAPSVGVFASNMHDDEE